MADDKPGEEAKAPEPDKTVTIAKRADAVPTKPEMSRFEHYRKLEVPKRYVLTGVASLMIGAIAFKIARLTGIYIPEFIGVPLISMVTLGFYKLSKPVMRRLGRPDPNVPTKLAEKSDTEIIRYAEKWVRDLSMLESNRSWKEIFDQLESTPGQLPQLLQPWRQANRDKERLEQEQKAFPKESSDPKIKETHEAYAKSIKAAEDRATLLHAVILQRICLFGLVGARYSEAQHASGSEAAAIQASMESIKQVNDQADSIIQDVVDAKKAAES